jgi:hypothetical protein
MKHVKLRPTEIRVMGRNYQVLFDHESPLELSSLGTCNNQLMLIAVKEGQHPVEEADTLVHEVFHAIWYTMHISGSGAGEEEVVRRMASGFMSVLMDNPQFLKYLVSIKNPPKLDL